MAEKKKNFEESLKKLEKISTSPESRGYHPGRCNKTIRRGDTLL